MKKQLRKDPVTSRWVIVNVEQTKGPADFQFEKPSKSSRTCPFCPGNESMTPREILALGRKSGGPDSPGWQVRVIPNKFPALNIEESTDKLAVGVYDKIGGFGAHEVIIETPDHNREIPDLPLEQVELLLRAYRERCRDLRRDPRFKYALIFKNYGAVAGATQEHPHSQLIALPVVPSRVAEEVKGSDRHFAETDRCLYCDILDQEAGERRLTVIEEGGYWAMTPFASRFPFETWILPRAHESAFDALSDERLAALARILKSTLGRLKACLNDPPYNFMIHTVPFQGRDLDSFHWHIEITPQLTQVAGFELGTGFYVNPTSPEDAAKALRQVPLPPL